MHPLGSPAHAHLDATVHRTELFLDGRNRRIRLLVQLAHGTHYDRVACSLAVSSCRCAASSIDSCATKPSLTSARISPVCSVDDFSRSAICSRVVLEPSVMFGRNAMAMRLTMA